MYSKGTDIVSAVVMAAMSIDDASSAAANAGDDDRAIDGSMNMSANTYLRLFSTL